MSGYRRNAKTRQNITRDCWNCCKSFRTTADSRLVERIRGDGIDRKVYFCSDSCFRAGCKKIGRSRSKTDPEKKPKISWLKDEVITLYEAGKSMQYIAEHFEVSVKTVRTRLLEWGVKLRGWGNGDTDFTRKSNICFDCENACGKCSWSKKFEPVPGWTAEPDEMPAKGRMIKTFHITECPLFEKTPKRYGCQATLTEEQNEEFLKFGGIEL